MGGTVIVDSHAVIIDFWRELAFGVGEDGFRKGGVREGNCGDSGRGSWVWAWLVLDERCAIAWEGGEAVVFDWFGHFGINGRVIDIRADVSFFFFFLSRRCEKRTRDFIQPIERDLFLLRGQRQHKQNWALSAVRNVVLALDSTFLRLA